MAVVRAALLAGCFLGLSLLPPRADAGLGSALFTEGVSAYKGGEYAAATHYFRQALAAGLETPALYYNLGASLYKLGHFADAEEAFRASGRDPAWTALARYNMALSAHARDARESAREYAEEAWRSAETLEVRALAAALLERLGAPRRSMHAALQVNAGHNDNVTLSADDQTLQTTRESDSFAQGLLSADGRFGKRRHAPLWEASVYHVNYRTLSENDITELLFGVTQPAASGIWRWEAGVQWQYLLLDGRPLQQAASLRLEGLRALPNGGNVRASARLSSIDARDGDFEFITGSRQQLEVSLGRPAGNGLLRTGITWERNDREDLVWGENFFSFSPMRHGFFVAGSWPIRSKWRFEPFAFYYHSRYADPDIRPGGLIRTREDRYIELSVRLKRRLSTTWRLIAEYAYVDNNSNFMQFSYRQRLIQLGLARPL